MLAACPRKYAIIYECHETNIILSLNMQSLLFSKTKLILFSVFPCPMFTFCYIMSCLVYVCIQRALMKCLIYRYMNRNRTVVWTALNILKI